MADMMERNALSNAQLNGSQAEMLVDQAVRTSPNVQRVGRVNITQGSIMSDVFFDNIFTDMSFHNKIKESAAQVQVTNLRLKAERDAARNRTDAAGAVVLQAARNLDARRQELDAFRRATFLSYVAAHPPPPSYDHVATTPTAPSPGEPLFPEANVPRPASESTENSAMKIDESGPHTLTSSPQSMPPNTEYLSNLSESGGSMQMPEAHAQSPAWGSRNPFAYAMAEQTRQLSQ